MKKTYSFCVNSIFVFCLIFLLFLTISSFFFTAYIDTAYSIEILLKHNNILTNLIFISFMLVLIHFISSIYMHITSNTLPLLIVSCVWAFCFSLSCSYFVKTGPASDGASVYYAAIQFSNNYFGSISDSGSYFTCYPFQLGLSFFYELIFRICHSTNFHIIQGCNAILIVLTIISQYSIIENLFKSCKCKIIYLILVSLCIPFLMYGSYIYGDIPSISFLSISGALLIYFFHYFTWASGLFSIFFAVCGVIVRKNSLIFVIAVSIIIFLSIIRNIKGNKAKLNILLCTYLVVFVLATCSSLPLVIRLYEYRSGIELNDGVPVSTYLAMGLMESNAGPGHYNGFNFLTFTEDADFNSQLASSLGWQAYKERYSYFIGNPPYALRFFTRKLINQWDNAGWAVYDSLHFSFGEKLPFVENCFSGPLYYVIISFFGKYQSFIYCLFLIFIISMYKKYRKNDLDILILLFPLVILGGGIFSLIWEASGRYVLPYCIFMLPFCAKGLQTVMEVFSKNE